MGGKGGLSQLELTTARLMGREQMQKDAWMKSEIQEDGAMKWDWNR